MEGEFKMKRTNKFLGLISIIISFVAVYGGIKPACVLIIYQPKAPKRL